MQQLDEGQWIIVTDASNTTHSRMQTVGFGSRKNTQPPSEVIVLIFDGPKNLRIDTTGSNRLLDNTHQNTRCAMVEQTHFSSMSNYS